MFCEEYPGNGPKALRGLLAGSFTLTKSPGKINYFLTVQCFALLSKNKYYITKELSMFSRVLFSNYRTNSVATKREVVHSQVIYSLYLSMYKEQRTGRKSKYEFTAERRKYRG
jgi:hypothetical protein